MPSKDVDIVTICLELLSSSGILRTIHRLCCPHLKSKFLTQVLELVGERSQNSFKAFRHFLSLIYVDLRCFGVIFLGGDMVLLTSECLENEIRQYQVKNAFSQTTTIQLRSLLKESGKFSGSSVILSFKGYSRDLILYICDICCMIKVLMPKTVAVEVCVARPTSEGTIFNDVLLICEGLTLPPEFSNLDRLGVGVAAYASSSIVANMGLPKIGKAHAGTSASSPEGDWCFEACFAVTESVDDDESSMITQLTKTKVLFFQDFICTAVPAIIAQTLKSKINWESFGLHVKDVQLTETGAAIIEWEGSSRLRSAELALHRYRSCHTKTISWPREVSLCKRCIEGALNDLKNQNPRLYISCEASKLQKYVPDLSSCLSRLIASSSDLSFKATCSDILGLESSDFDGVEACIRSRILKVIEDLDVQSAKEGNPSNKKSKNNCASECGFILQDNEEEPEERDDSEENIILDHL